LLGQQNQLSDDHEGIEIESFQETIYRINEQLQELQTSEDGHDAPQTAPDRGNNQDEIEDMDDDSGDPSDQDSHQDSDQDDVQQTDPSFMEGKTRLVTPRMKKMEFLTVINCLNLRY